MSWSEEETKVLKKLWSSGLSASKISLRIPGKTRNACIGRANRLNLEARAPSKRTAHKVNTENTDNNVKPEVKIQRFGRKAKFRALILDPSFEKENPTKLEELTDETCRWPTNHPRDKDFYFCGRKPMEKFPYCKLHVLYAFQPRNAKEDDQITEDDIPKFISVKKIKSA